ncbi:hypothetical protein PMAG_a1766 [Pseudoalteromonas mariniglutinosa NCIMB 1770]|nr:hypothetical protein [Pseudoalteromonas mariniglutinosa NCIMB 1770]
MLSVKNGQLEHDIAKLVMCIKTQYKALIVKMEKVNGI